MLKKTILAVIVMSLPLIAQPPTIVTPTQASHVPLVDKSLVHEVQALASPSINQTSDQVLMTAAGTCLERCGTEADQCATSGTPILVCAQRLTACAHSCGF